jgi:hypothetical protein
LTIVAITIIDNYTKAEVFDLYAGKKINVIPLNKDEMRQPFTDVVIVNSSRANFSFLLMTNKELKAYENGIEKMVFAAKPDELFIYCSYDHERSIPVICSVTDGELEMKERPINDILKPFVIGFNPKTDVIIKTWQQTLIIKFPPHSKSTMIIANRAERREMLISEIEREVGPEFQVLYNQEP